MEGRCFASLIARVPNNNPRFSEVPLESNLIVMERQPLEKQRCSPFLSQH